MQFFSSSILLFLLLVTCHIRGLSQKSKYVFQNYNKSDGLPSNTVYSAVSDKNGILWFGTDAGVLKFVNGRFKLFTTADGLPSNEVFSLYCDSKNRIWVSTIKSEIVYFEKDKIVTASQKEFLKDLATNGVVPYYLEDSYGRIWAQSSNKNSIKYLGKNDSVTTLSFTNPVSKNGHTFYVEAKDTLLFGGPGSLIAVKNNKTPFIIDVVTNYIQNTPYKDLFFHNNSLYGLREDYKVEKVSLMAFLSSKYYIRGGKIGLKKIFNHYIYPKGDRFIILPPSNLSNAQTLIQGVHPGTSCTGPFSSFWVSTLDRGVFSFKNLEIKLFANVLEPSSKKITSVSFNDDFIICGNSVGEVYILNKRDYSIKNKISLISPNDQLAQINSIAKTEANDFFVNTSNKLFKFSKNGTRISISNQLTIKKVYPLGKLLLMCHFGGFSTMNIDSLWETMPPSEYLKRIYSYTSYKNKNVFGTQDSLLFWNKNYEIPKNKFNPTSILSPYPLKQEFNYRALDLNVYKDSLLIATTAENGIIIIKDSNIIKTINTSNGLITNSCYRSVIYKDHLFTATNKGIHIYNLLNGDMYHAFESDGLPSNTVNDIAIDKDTIYAATEEGLCILPIASIKKDKSFPFFIEPIIVHTDTLWDKPQSIVSRTNYNIRFSMNALSYASKSPITFYYRLRELDTTFTSTSDADVNIQIPHTGTFTLECYAMNEEMVKSNLSSIKIEVKPYYYQTVLFKIIVGLIIIALLYWAYRMISKQSQAKAQAKNEIENKIRSLELEAWRSNINPHFLFNSLNTIQGLFVKGNLQEVNTYIAEFSSMLRKTIDQSSKLLATVAEEVEYIGSYLELERIKRQGKMEYHLTVQESIKQYYIPTLLLQPIIENSLKHGIQDKQQGRIDIDISQENDRIKCTIEDNGEGFDLEKEINPAHSKGYQLIKSKIEMIEKISSKSIIFTFGNKKGTHNQVLGAQTVFYFPILLHGYDDTNTTNR